MGHKKAVTLVIFIALLLIPLKIVLASQRCQMVDPQIGALVWPEGCIKGELQLILGEGTRTLPAAENLQEGTKLEISWKKAAQLSLVESWDIAGRSQLWVENHKKLEYDPTLRFIKPTQIGGAKVHLEVIRTNLGDPVDGKFSNVWLVKEIKHAQLWNGL